MKLVLRNRRLPEGHAVVTLSGHKRNSPFKEVEFGGRKVWISQRNYWVDSKKHTVHSNLCKDTVFYFIHVFDDYYYQGQSNWLSTFKETGMGSISESNVRQISNNPDFFKQEIQKMSLKLEY